jgi:hypothetical protein
MYAGLILQFDYAATIKKSKRKDLVKKACMRVANEIKCSGD